MENIEMNQAAVKLLQEWDPFQIGTESYDTEAADIVAALQSAEDVKQLAQIIQRVYELSFEELLSMEKCVAIAQKLFALRSQLSCSL